MIHPEHSETAVAVLIEEKAEARPQKKHAPLTRLDSVLIVLPISIFVLWWFSLKGITLRQMNDLGLISVFSPVTILALALMMISFCVSVQRPQLRTLIMLLHICLLIFMLYGVTTLIEEAPRFSVLYRHAGYTEYIMRTGTIDPNLDAYFNWPGFFILSAFVTRITGSPDILGYAVWSPVFLNLIYLGPMLIILNTATTNKRLVWLALWFFYLTNWIGQDYYSPQGLNFFLYLVIIALLLRWFQIPADARNTRGGRFPGHSPSLVRRLYGWFATPAPGIEAVNPAQRRVLLALLLIIFAFVVFSHPLTPFFVLASVTALVIFRRCTPFWLPIVMAIMTAAWILLMTRAFLAGHLSWVTGGIGQLTSIFSSNVSSRVAGSPQHTLIAELRLLTTAVVWGLALVGCIRRIRQGYRDANALLLAIMPFPLLIVQPYGGEMLLRIYLFSLPLMVFFVASLFCTEPAACRQQDAKQALLAPAHFARLRSLFASTRWIPPLMMGLSLLLLAGFLFTRYGNERQDYMTFAEVAGVRHLYSIAQPGSIFIEGIDGTPWQFQDYEKYNTYVISDSLQTAIANRDVAAITQLIREKKHTRAYLIFTRSQEATAEATFGLPPGTLARLEQALLASGQYKLVYSNPDAQILLFVEDSGGGGPR